MSMVSEKKLANAVGGKTARACDSCIRKRARWYCPADDAFLCQACDASVHSANPLARRHERVRLKTATFKHSEDAQAALEDSLPPSWHKGFTRKARTPRNRKSGIHQFAQNPFRLVPEIGSDEATSLEDNEEQLLYRVPIFDPLAAELCLSTTSNDLATNAINVGSEENEGNEAKAVFRDCGNDDENILHDFLPSEMDLADFAADVESLLGKGLDEESFDMEGLGILDCREKDSMEGSSGSGLVKVEDDEVDTEAVMGSQIEMEMDLTREIPLFELNFDYDSPIECEQGGDNGGNEYAIENKREDCEVGEPKKKRILLALDYEGVLAAWADQRSPWTNGDRPELDPCWPDCMGGCGRVHHPFGDMGMMSGHPTMMDGGREARVSRYREKRRTRLFSKKIRYEVRKLNAEKRPRMKGRFVKRANFAGPGIPLLTSSSSK
ncbi:hypothetical protein RJ640_017953 [Escallonia rubra]|uniref:Uncharacterized protein n=1 Tax=Escallonia rubra TaxID=112253 RepID=A0AA88QIZ8_9ASTE|nr:hypothetical protein RJ640_017953 [Escallonia rubra]